VQSIIIEVMASNSRTTKTITRNSRKIKDAVKRATASKDSATRFLKSAGIMTAKGNLSPKYK